MVRARTSTTALFLLAAVALGACAENAGDSASAPAASSGAAGAAVDPAQNPNWLDLSGCAGNQSIVHYRIGAQPIQLPQSIVRRLILLEAGATANIDREKPLVQQVPKGTGCADQPLPVGGAITQSNFDSDLLEGTVTLFATPASLVENYGKLITRLHKERPSNACQPAEGDLFLCFGQEQQRGKTANVLYVITATDQKLNFGAPAFARCEIQGGKPVGCNLGDIVSPELFFDATLSRLPRSTADLRAAHSAILKQFGVSRSGQSG